MCAPRGSISASEINATAVGVVDAMLGSALVPAWVKDPSGVAWSSHSLEHNISVMRAQRVMDVSE